MSLYQRIKLQGFLQECLYFLVFWIAFQTALRVIIVLAKVELLPLCQQTSLISYLFWSHVEKKWSSLQKAFFVVVCVSFLPLTAHFPYLQAIIRSCIRSVWGELIWAPFICCVSFVHTHTFTARAETGFLGHTGAAVGKNTQEGLLWRRVVDVYRCTQKETSDVV